MATEQPIQCAKCGKLTLHRAVDNVMKCNVCEPAISATRENLHTLIWIGIAIAITVAGLAVCSGAR